MAKLLISLRTPLFLVLLLPACGSGVLSGKAHADTNDPGFYLGGRLLPAISTTEGEAISGGGTGPFSRKGDEFDTTIGASLLAGYHWSDHGVPLRTELEVAYRARTDFNTRQENSPAVGYKNDLSSTSAILSAFYDIPTGTPWRPYLGGGIGWARNSSDTTRALNDTSEPEQTLENDTDNLAYSLQVGVRVAISPEWVGEIAYRYMDFGEVSSGTFSGGEEVTADSHVFHDVIFGISYLF